MTRYQNPLQALEEAHRTATKTQRPCWLVKHGEAIVVTQNPGLRRKLEEVKP